MPSFGTDRSNPSRRSSNPANRDSLTRAAENIILRSFGLQPDQNLLIFADPASLDVATIIAEAAQGIYEPPARASTSIFFIPYAVQEQFEINESLPLPIEAAIREADAVLSCLSDRPEHAAYRRRLLRTGWSRRVKLAHAPGMTEYIMAMANTDFDLIQHRCHVLATALVLAKQVTIYTEDKAGQERCLQVEIAGWDFTPGISDGTIPDGAWSNLPPGETFVVPPDASGQIVVNGSIPGRVLAPSEELILTFDRGRLVELQPGDSEAGLHLYRTQIAYAKGHDDPNWSNLAELGFGVNPAVQELTGVALVDEKKAGTIHIALGDSDSLGGRVESTIHCDLVVEGATVLVDGRPLLERGQWRGDDQEWSPDYRTVTVPEGWWANIREIRRSGVRADRSGDRLLRHWNSGPGRWDSTPVGSDATAQLAARLYRLLPEHGERLSREALLAGAQELGFDEQTTAALTWIMRQYDLLRLPGEQVS